ncbi:hypothetical protein LTR37_005411 [Vermiconidia calcicola]|uniref:Uncharacterized protein n=1 Tax=Vermiconidia calcicola TaxID=1690605 RepID=A0ACC3NJI7_9PEZI|nr:hypothetical protein LTR37_005411 [Vermiconidia calcicola]
MDVHAEDQSPQILLYLLKAAYFYDQAEDTLKSQILQAYIYGRYNTTTIGKANVAAYSDTGTVLPDKDGENTCFTYAKDNAIDCIRAAARCVSRTDSEEMGRLGNVLAMIGFPVLDEGELVSSKYGRAAVGSLK